MRVSADGTPPGNPTPLPSGPAGLAYGANVYLHATTDSTVISLQRLASNGAFLGDPIIINEHTYTAPVVGSDGRNFLVIWPKESELRAALVTPDGEVGMPRTIATTPIGGIVTPHVASNGQCFMVT